MLNPYSGRPDGSFWRRAVAIAPADVDPVGAAKFLIAASDKIATAGSCFAQHISRTLVRQGFDYLVTETGPPERGFGTFPARFGNIYSPAQLLQLFRRAYGLFEPTEEAWTRPDGRLVDPFRPQVEPQGFATIEALRADRDQHLAAVRRMFEDCDVFIFTLGLTEAWRSTKDGAVFPLAPGVAAAPDHGDIAFHNFTIAEISADLTAFMAAFRAVNPRVRVIFTVSPVPLVATYEDRHVLVSTIYSKSVLRVAAEDVSRNEPSVAYFPSYEIVTGHHTGYRYFDETLRNVTPQGVEAVMGLFSRHYLAASTEAPATPVLPAKPPAAPVRLDPEFAALSAIICDEEAIDS
ncbi:GSCFA family protein [Humitalea rosea]|uniref:GSCFA family protein n=1 Tax=Humitalea rosea TaxID=990373 RepID=A0A2W7IIZ4_9PROT|nr:GSCFA domain-containing protein [Humitalea rosea]PZW45634.1 GSCFA family protein [Humitalea rosea]